MKIKEFLSFWENNYELYAVNIKGDIIIRDGFYDLEIPFATPDEYTGFITLTQADIELMNQNKSYLDLIPDSNFDFFLDSENILEHCHYDKDKTYEIKDVIGSTDRGDFYMLAEKLGALGVDISETKLEEICDLLKGNGALDFSEVVESELDELDLEQ